MKLQKMDYLSFQKVYFYSLDYSKEFKNTAENFHPPVEVFINLYFFNNKYLNLILKYILRTIVS